MEDASVNKMDGRSEMRSGGEEKKTKNSTNVYKEKA
jgi:hypothetical protein